MEDLIGPRGGGVRVSLARWLESRPVQTTIVALILLNALTLGLETSTRVMGLAGPLIVALDRTLLGIFALELALKLVAFRRGFFRNPWNLFDLFVVGVALLPATGPFAVLRVLRILRLVSVVPRFRFIVESLLRAIPGILSIAGLLMILFYVAAVMATGLFSQSFPDWFGTIGGSMYTLFQIMTLESWSMGIVRPIMAVHPWAWAFFIPFILIATFTMLNLFIAIIVSAMQALPIPREGGAEPEPAQPGDGAIAAELRALRTEIRTLRERLDVQARI